MFSEPITITALSGRVPVFNVNVSFAVVDEPKSPILLRRFLRRKQ